jgi:hypothetical protein
MRTVRRLAEFFGIWSFCRAIWEAIGHIGNFQTLWDMVSATVQHWPKVLRAFAWIIVSWWFPLVATVVCLIIWWRLRMPRRMGVSRRVDAAPNLDRTRMFNVRCGTGAWSENILTGNIPARYLHAEISIASGAVHGAKAYLTKIKGGGKQWTGNEQLTFEPSEAPDSLSKALYAGVPYRIDVLQLTSDGEVRVCNYNRQWPRFPRLTDLFASSGWYELTIVVAGEDAAGETFKLHFEWTGKWQTAFLYDQRVKTLSQPNRDDRLEEVEKERAELLKELHALKEQPLTGLRLRNACDDWIENGKKIIVRLTSEDPSAIPDAKDWLDGFQKFTALNLPIKDYDKCNFGNESGETFHQEKTKVDPSWEPHMYAAFIGHKAAMLLMFRRNIT